MQYTASNESTWDMMAFQAGLSEFAMDSIMYDNRYYYADVVAFVGGEIIDVNVEQAVDDATIKAPWDSDAADPDAIKAPWGV